MHPPPTPTVLYVEDQPVNILVMQALFEQMPALQLVVATSGREALHAASGLRPALLILDLNLPDCHGTQLLHVLRLLPGCESVPAVTATADTEFELAGSGFDELWPKPLNLNFVRRRIEELTRTAFDPDAAALRAPTPRLAPASRSVSLR